MCAVKVRKNPQEDKVVHEVNGWGTVITVYKQLLILFIGFNISVINNTRTIWVSARNGWIVSEWFKVASSDCVVDRSPRKRDTSGANVTEVSNNGFQGNAPIIVVSNCFKSAVSFRSCCWVAGHKFLYFC